MTADRALLRIVATTDVHSAFDNAEALLTHLHDLRPTSLITDCGDFFEGSGYYRLTHGAIEREILLGLYDVLAPGNHGWPHHFEPELHRLTVCSNAVDAVTGDALFRRLHTARVGGRRVAITAVIGQQAFNAIPAEQRAGHGVTNPVQALREVMLAYYHEVDDWILLSHSGFDEDLKLAAACPFLNVIFAGHCHSDQYGPVHVGDTLVLKGRELAAGYAYAEPIGTGWAASTADFPKSHPGPRPDELVGTTQQIDHARRELEEPIGPISKAYRHQVPDRRHLLAAVATRLHTGLGADAVILNETALRPVPLGGTLTRGDLLAIEPFGNQLVHAQIPDRYRAAPQDLLARLAEQAGPLVTVPGPLPDGITTVLTTDYIADNHLGQRTHEAGLRLDQAVQHVLTTPSSDTAPGDTR
ncbi:metallophosphoesterase [Streptomyces mirabilis]|uniref:metallophosphoesterase n=1 Tax=Streptomyces TaxID=1883 RepID=UPI000BB0CD32|nr:metallophosphoesterase [Streptomyces sp. Ag82_O1-15]PBC97300.1 2',3'-cyclic-nucleotide 2'-phosphodiesterase (5'-nucleotidase family) [Streptomyces sp. Ag82_O1-15]